MGKAAHEPLLTLHGLLKLGDVRVDGFGHVVEVRRKRTDFVTRADMGAEIQVAARQLPRGA